MKIAPLLGAFALNFSLATAAFAAGAPPPMIPADEAEKDLALVPATDPATPGAPSLLPAVKGKHPRLMFSREEMAALKGKISSDPNLQKAYDGTLQWAKIAPVPVNPRPPVVSDDTSALVKSLAQGPAMAYAYALNHDDATKQKIIDTLTALIKEPYWADGKELDSNMGAACNMFLAGLLFDTVHDDLDPKLRGEIAANLFLHARRMYHLGHKQALKFPGAGYWQADPQPNHRWYRDMGLAACVLSVADEPGIDASFMLKGLKDEMDFVMKWYPPDGDCHEGPSYQAFGYLPIASATQMMDRVLGTTYLKTSGVKLAATQQLYYWVPGRNSSIGFGDDQNPPGGTFGNNEGAFFFSTLLTRDKNMQAAMLRRIDISNRANKTGKPPLYPWSMLAFYDPSLSGGDWKAFPLAKVFPDIGAATMRDSWDEKSVVFTFKCGPYGGNKLNEYRQTTLVDGKPHYINVAHDDPDANEFALALNDGFVFHPGVYSEIKNTDEHNTLTVDDRGQAGEGDKFSQPVGDLDMRTLSSLTGWKQDAKGHIIIEGEAGNAYRGVNAKEMKGKPVPPAVLSKFRRTAIWMPGEYILVLDNIAAASGAHKLTWRGVSPKAQVDAEGKGVATSETGEAVGFQYVSNQKAAASVNPNFVLDGRWGKVPVQQTLFEVNAPALRAACLLDPWKKQPTVKMASSGGTVTLTVQTGASTDTWTWQDTKDATTPTDIRGTRGGQPLIALTAADKAPKE